MSHVATVKCYVQSLDDTAAAAKALGFVLVRNVTAFAVHGYDVPPNCEHKLQLADHKAGDYEIGLVKRTDGKAGWELFYNNWGQGGQRLHEKAGPGLNKLKSAIAEQVTRRILARQGYRIARTVNASTGAIELTATK